MLKKKKICAGYNGVEHEDFIYSNINGKKYCKSCSLKIKKPKGLKPIKDTLKRELKKEKTKELHNFFLSLWDKQSNSEGDCICFESGVLLDKHHFRENTCCYSHILPKSKYPEYSLMEWNIKIVHPDKHADFENNEDKTPNQKNYKKYLLNKIKKDNP